MNRIGQAEIDAMIKMPFDLEIIGRLYYQAIELWHRGIFKPKGEERDIFIAVLLDVTIKLSAMQYHLKNYEHHEALCIEQLKEKCGEKTYMSLQAHELLFELEAFMFQMKSALDFAVKFPEALFPKRFKTKTFGDMGEDLIKGLENYKKDKNAKKEIVDSIIAMIRDDQKTWLKQAVTLRTSLNHFKTIADYNYQANKNGSEWEIIVPRIARLNVLTYMNRIYTNCLEFIQDFMCLVIGMYLPKSVTVGVKESYIASNENPIEKYIKFGLVFSEVSANTSNPKS